MKVKMKVKMKVEVKVKVRVDLRKVRLDRVWQRRLLQSRGPLGSLCKP